MYEVTILRSNIILVDVSSLSINNLLQIHRDSTTAVTNVTTAVGGVCHEYETSIMDALENKLTKEWDKIPQHAKKEKDIGLYNFYFLF